MIFNFYKFNNPANTCRIFLRVVLASLFAAQICMASVETNPKDRAKWRLAARAAAKSAQESLETLPTPDDSERVIFTEHLSTAMVSDITAHSAREASMEKSRVLARAWRIETANTLLSKAAEEMSAYSPAPVTREDILKILGQDWPELVDKQIEKFLDKSFSPVFEEARQRVVAVAALEADKKLRYPSIPELDSELSGLLNGQSPDTRLSKAEYARLKKWLETYAGASDKPMFEEVREHISQSGSRMLNEIRRQYEIQTGALDEALSATPATMLRAETIRQYLSGSINKILDTVQPQGGAPRYDVFAVVVGNLSADAETLQTKRLTQFINSTVPKRIASKEIENLMLSNITAHSSFQKSFSMLSDHFMKTAPAEIADAYAALADPRENADFFVSLLNRTDIKSQINKNIDSRLNALLPEIRKNIAAKQYSEHFTALSENIPLNDKTLADIEKNRGAPVQTAAKGIELLGAGGYPDLSNPEKLQLLDETAELVIGRVSVIISNGYWAVTEQINLLSAMENKNIDKLRKDVSANRPLKEIMTDWRTQLEGSWKTTLEKVPETPYTKLLANTETQLNKTVRQLYDTLKSEPDTSKQPVATEGEPEDGETVETRAIEARPEKTHDKAAGADEQEEVAETGDDGAVEKVMGAFSESRIQRPDGVIMLSDRPDGSCEVKFYSQTALAGEIQFQAEDVEAGAEAVFSALKPALEIIMKSAEARWKEKSGFLFFRRRPDPELRLYMVVESNEVRHRMNLLLRKRIEAMLDEWSEKNELGESPVTLDWKVSLNLSGNDE